MAAAIIFHFDFSSPYGYFASTRIDALGGLMGLAFGVILSRLFLTAMTNMSGYRITYMLPLENILAALLIALITSQVAALLPTLRAARIRILEAIQYE